MSPATISSIRRRLAVAVIVWTLLAWGGRIGLLAGGEGWLSWLRIGGSLAIGAATALALVISSLGALLRPLLLLFATWSVLLWGRSLIADWAGSGSLPFKLVHTLLGLGFFALACWAIAAARRHPVPGPDEGDREKQR